MKSVILKILCILCFVGNVYADNYDFSALNASYHRQKDSAINNINSHANSSKAHKNSVMGKSFTYVRDQINGIASSFKAQSTQLNDDFVSLVNELNQISLPEVSSTIKSIKEKEKREDCFKCFNFSSPRDLKCYMAYSSSYSNNCLIRTASSFFKKYEDLPVEFRSERLEDFYKDLKELINNRPIIEFKFDGED